MTRKFKVTVERTDEYTIAIEKYNAKKEIIIQHIDTLDELLNKYRKGESLT